MPHLTLTYSANLAPIGDSSALFDALHRRLAEVSGLQIDFFKSRACRCDDFFVGDGAADHAFAHLEILIFPGRPIEFGRAVTEAAMAILNDRLGWLRPELALQITVDLGDLDKETYRKSSRARA